MWSNFLARDDDPRPMGGRGTRRGNVMSDSKEGKVKLCFFLALVGVTLMVLAVGTDFWAELNGQISPHNATCQAAHFGIWRHCLKIIEVLDLEPGRNSCGPVELPGVSNCTYFRFFKTGEKATIMAREAKKDLFVVLAIFALSSLVLMILGCISVTRALNRNPDFMIKLAGILFICSGVTVTVTIAVFQEATRMVLRSNELVPVEFSYMWSLACAIAAAAIVGLAGVSFLLVAYPGCLRKTCCFCQEKDGNA